MWFMLIHLLFLPNWNHLKANGKTVIFKDRELTFFSKHLMQQDSNHCPWIRPFCSPTMESGMLWQMQSTNSYSVQKVQVSDQNHASCWFWSAFLPPQSKRKKPNRYTIFPLGNLKLFKCLPSSIMRELKPYHVTLLFSLQCKHWIKLWGYINRQKRWRYFQILIYNVTHCQHFSLNKWWTQKISAAKYFKNWKQNTLEIFFRNKHDRRCLS